MQNLKIFTFYLKISSLNLGKGSNKICLFSNIKMIINRIPNNLEAKLLFYVLKFSYPYTLLSINHIINIINILLKTERKLYIRLYTILFF